MRENRVSIDHREFAEVPLSERVKGYQKNFDICVTDTYFDGRDEASLSMSAGTRRLNRKTAEVICLVPTPWGAESGACRKKLAALLCDACNGSIAGLVIISLATPGLSTQAILAIHSRPG